MNDTAASTDPQASASSSLTVRQALRRSWPILTLEFWWGIGAGLAYQSTVILRYVEILGASKFVIGLIPAVFFGMLAICPILSGRVVSRATNRHVGVMFLYVSCGLSYLLVGILTWFLPGNAQVIKIATVVVGVGLFTTFAGLADPQYVGLCVDAIPSRAMGRFFALRLMAYNAGGVVGGLVSCWLLKTWPSQIAYPLSFMVAGLSIVFAVSHFLIYQEVRFVKVAVQGNLWQYLMGLTRAARASSQYVWLSLFITFYLVGKTSYDFLGIYLREKNNFGDQWMSILTITGMLSSLIFSLILGWVGDHWGHRKGLVISLVASLIGTSFAILDAHSLISALIAYALASSWLALLLISAYNLALRSLPTLEPADVFVVWSLSQLPGKVIGTPALGWCIDHFGYGISLWSCVGLVFIAFLMLGRLRVNA